MKNTLLALMLVATLFVISCGADATKPQDAYKTQPTETKTGTKTKTLTAAAGTVDLASSSYSLEFGEKVTEIVQVVTVTTDMATGTTTTNKNTVTGTTKNADGGIYQFTISDNTATSATVTYKYSKREAAPIVEKETIGTYTSTSTGTLTIYDTEYNDAGNKFNKDVISVTDKNGKQLIEYTDYYYNTSTDTITIYNTSTSTIPTYNNGDEFTIRYSYRNISMISEQPLTGSVTPTATTPDLNATIQLTDAAAYAGRSCYIKADLYQSTSSGYPTTAYYNVIIPSTGIITITAPTGLTAIASGTYELWVY